MCFQRIVLLLHLHSACALLQSSYPMNLVIDKGNTSVKCAVYDGEEQVVCRRTRAEDFSANALGELLGKYDIDCAACACSGGMPAWLPALLRERGIDWLVVTGATPAPLQPAYTEPEKFGGDRWAALIGAAALSPDTPLLVCDAGTCLTFDVATSDLHLGGMIAPGLTMRLRAMHDYTHALPLVEAEGEATVLAADTDSALRAGALYGMAFELSSYMIATKQNLTGVQCFLTGGDAERLVALGLNDFRVEPDLVLIGLNKILTYHYETT